MFSQIVMRYFVDVSGWQQTMFGAAAIGIVLSAVIWMSVRDVNPYHKEHHSQQKTELRDVLYGLGRAFKNPQIWLCGMVGCLLYLFLSSFAELWGPAYLEQAHGIVRSDAASANSMIFLGCAIGAPFAGWFSDLIRKRRLPIIVSSIGALIAVSLLIYVHHLPLVLVYILLFLFGFLSSVQVLVFAIARELTPIEISGSTIGLINMFVMIGGIFFPPVIGKLLDVYWDGTLIDGARVYSEHAFSIALTILPVGIALGTVLTFFIRETHCEIYSGIFKKNK